MARSGNRRRRASYSYPASPSGSFHPKDQLSSPPGPDRQQQAMDFPTNGVPDRQSTAAASDQRSNGADHHTSSSSGKYDAADRQANGGEHRQNGGQNGGDHHRQNGSDHRYNGGSRRFDGSERSRKDGNDQKPHASDAHHRRSRSRDRPPYYQHYQKNQRWEGKENTDQNKDPSSAIARDEDAGKSQEYTPYMASRARELKEEGNRKFQRKDYLGAMDQYELALKLTPPDHPDRAVFHSNRAACLMQMKPAQHDAAIRECNLALEAHPGFARALLRRARAYEALGKLELALQDVQTLLQGDVSHPDALDMAKRIRLSMGCQGDEAERDQGRPPTPAAYSRSKSFAGSFVASTGAATPISASRSFSVRNASDHGSAPMNFTSSQQMQTSSRPPSALTSSQSYREMQSPPQGSLSWSMHSPPSTPSNEIPGTCLNKSGATPHMPPMDPSKVDSSEKIIHQDSPQSSQIDTSSAVPLMRPVKLIYDHDIRLAEMPVNCKFGELRTLVKSKFPSSKAILIKYKDVEGDLVTITSTEELRLAEAAAAIEAARRNLRVNGMSTDGGAPQDRRSNSAIGLPVVPSVLDQLRLHIVEVPAEQEPYDKEETISMSAQEPTPSSNGMGKAETSDSKGVKERDFDKWLLEFAQLFRTHLGIDPRGHVDFQELGLELCAEALEETITTEAAHKLFEQAGCKFQEMVALGFLNWGNVHMCAARKEVPSDDENDCQMDFCEKLQAAFDWAHAQYALAEEKFLLSLKVKPDFCDGMLGLGQKYFESAKLNWALAVANQKDLREWDPSRTLELFRTAAGHARKAEESLLKREEMYSKDVEKQGDAGIHPKIANLEQDTALKTQIYLFWGNILYEHSQVEFRLGLHTWKELLEGAVHKFEVAGVPSADITMALHKHLSSSSAFIDTGEESAEQVGGVCEGEKTTEIQEVRIGLLDDDHEKKIKTESPCEEHMPPDGVTDIAESIQADSSQVEHEPEQGLIDVAKSRQAESPCVEHVSRDDVISLAEGMQVEPLVKEDMPEDGVVQMQSLMDDHVTSGNAADMCRIWS